MPLLEGQSVPLCHWDVICILRSQHNGSVLGFPWPGGHLEERQTWDGETGGEQTQLSCSSFHIPPRLKACFYLQDFLLFSFQHLVWKEIKEIIERK